MASAREKVFAFLDEQLGVGAGCTIADYDSKASVLDYATEVVGEDDGLTEGCGVGPLMGHIEEWVDAFAQDERSEPLQEEFCLGIQFHPSKLGYRLFRSEEAFNEVYPSPFETPDDYPVFVRAIVSAGLAQGAFSGKSVLSYLYMRDVTVVG